MTITLPYNFTPRPYQMSLLKAFDSGLKRYIGIWHRRAGKDKTALNLTVKKAFERVGAYYYFFPTYRQGKKILWDGVDETGMKFLDHIPPQLIRSKNNTEMKIDFVNGSLFQIWGTENPDAIRGTNPVGCVFSEYSYQDPEAWEIVRPILRKNGGWAIFLFTPAGKNHAYELYEMAKDNPEWMVEVLTVNNTGVFSKEDIERDRKEGMPEEFIQQEYYCSFEAPLKGAYYAKEMMEAEREGRITNVPHEKTVPVNTVWDLGVGDSTAIWFIQCVGKEIRLIDYYEASGEGLDHYVRVLQQKPYIYGKHYAPFDIEVKELGTGKSRKEIARSLGIDFVVVPKLPLADGINAVRMLFNRFWFDKEKCKRGISALRSYRREYNTKLQEFKDHPVHDWACHAADALRYFAVAYQEPRDNKKTIKPHYYHTQHGWMGA